MAEEYIDSLSHFILRIRENSEMTQEDLAEKSGVPLSIIARTERGARHRFTPEQRNALARTLDVAPEEIQKREQTREGPGWHSR